jgi:hypothetical protein
MLGLLWRGYLTKICSAYNLSSSKREEADKLT